MLKVEIRDSVLEDVVKLALTMREEDKNEAIALGLDPTEGLYYAYTHSVYRKTALVEGVVAAMWGIGGDLFGDVGRPYFITGEEVYKITPLEFSRIYTKEVGYMKKFFPYLENFVDASYEGAVRMLKIAGFKLEGPYELGLIKHPFYKFSMVSDDSTNHQKLQKSSTSEAGK